jgi:hypothetical protein
MPFCSQCGSSVPSGSTFCSNCGKSVAASTDSAVGKTAGTPSIVSEREFYKGPGVLVTNSRFIVGPQTFTMSGVTSVSSYTQPPSHTGPVILIILGILFSLGGCAQASQGGGSWGVVFGLLVAAAGVWWFLSRKPTYHVLLRSSSGEAKPLGSQDSSYIGDVVNALNSAIVYRQ